MTTKVTGAAWLLALALSVGAGAAGTSETGKPSSKWWQNPVCKTRVGLTNGQAAEIERIFQSVRVELRAEKAELEKQEAALSRLLPRTRWAAFFVTVRTIDRVEAARSALAKTRTLMLYRMHRLLSPEQRVRLEAFERERARNADKAPVNRSKD